MPCLPPIPNSSNAISLCITMKMKSISTPSFIVVIQRPISEKQELSLKSSLFLKENLISILIDAIEIMQRKIHTAYMLYMLLFYHCDVELIIIKRENQVFGFSANFRLYAALSLFLSLKQIWNSSGFLQ